MPLEPSPGLLKKMKGRGPTSTKGPSSPSLLRDIIEGIIDTGMGAIGVGPDTKMNRVGGLLGTTLPLGRYGSLKLKGSDFPAQNRLAMGMSPTSGKFDDAGRYLAPADKVDTAFTAHVGSSVGKHKKLNIQSPEEAFVSSGEHKGPSPSNAMIKELTKKYKK